MTYNELLTAKQKLKKRTKKAKKLAVDIALLTAATPHIDPAARSEASDAEAPPRAPP